MGIATLFCIWNNPPNCGLVWTACFDGSYSILYYLIFLDYIFLNYHAKSFYSLVFIMFWEMNYHLSLLCRKRSYTDTANFTLRCGQCSIGLVGQKVVIMLSSLLFFSFPSKCSCSHVLVSNGLFGKCRRLLIMQGKQAMSIFRNIDEKKEHPLDFSF